MIRRLKGTLIEKKPPFLMLEVAGIGYEIQSPLSTFFQLPELGKEVTLHTHFVVREDAQLLFGFWDQEDRYLFTQIIKVSGIGPKVGLAILSGMSSEEFLVTINDQDIARLQKVPGIGKKTAERLIIELQDKFKNLSIDGAKFNTANAASGGVSFASKSYQDAIDALVSLGYKPLEAKKAVSKVDNKQGTPEEVIRAALKGLAKA